MAASPTALAKLALGTADPVDFAIRYSDFDPGVGIDLVDANATRGSYNKDGILVVQDRTRVAPRLVCQPNATELAYLLEWAMGGTPTGTSPKTYPLADTPAARYAYFKPVAGDQWFYNTLAVDNFEVSSQIGQPLTTTLDLVGKSIDATRNDFPSLTVNVATRPFILSQLALTAGGSTRQTTDFTYRLERKIDRERFLNSPTLTDFVGLDRAITVSINVPAGDNAAFWDDGIGGVTLSATFTNAGSGAFVLGFSDIRFRPVSPTYPRNAEGYVRLQGEAYRPTVGGVPHTITLALGT